MMILEVLFVLVLGVVVCVMSIHRYKSHQHPMSGDARSFVRATLAADSDPEMTLYILRNLEARWASMDCWMTEHRATVQARWDRRQLNHVARVTPEHRSGRRI